MAEPRKEDIAIKVFARTKSGDKVAVHGEGVMLSAGEGASARTLLRRLGSKQYLGKEVTQKVVIDHEGIECLVESQGENPGFDKRLQGRDRVQGDLSRVMSEGHG